MNLGVLPPIIGTPPSSTAVYSGRPASFTVGASGVGTVTYQWQKSTVPNIWQHISGATNAAYLIPSASSGNAGSYRVIVTDQGLSGAFLRHQPNPGDVDRRRPARLPPCIMRWR